jgi:hypothetical protein
MSFAAWNWLLSEKTHLPFSIFLVKFCTTNVRLFFIEHMQSNNLCSGKGDPSLSSASAKEIQRERDLETLLSDPPALPFWLKQEERKTSKIDPEVRTTH